MAAHTLTTGARLTKLRETLADLTRERYVELGEGSVPATPAEWLQAAERAGLSIVRWDGPACLADNRIMVPEDASDERAALTIAHEIAEFYLRTECHNGSILAVAGVIDGASKRNTRAGRRQAGEFGDGEVWQERLPGHLDKLLTARENEHIANQQMRQAQESGNQKKIDAAKKAVFKAEDRYGDAQDGLYAFIESAIETAVPADRAQRSQAAAA